MYDSTLSITCSYGALTTCGLTTTKAWYSAVACVSANANLHSGGGVLCLRVPFYLIFWSSRFRIRPVRSVGFVRGACIFSRIWTNADRLFLSTWISAWFRLGTGALKISISCVLSETCPFFVHLRGELAWFKIVIICIFSSILHSIFEEYSRLVVFMSAVMHCLSLSSENIHKTSTRSSKCS